MTDWGLAESNFLVVRIKEKVSGSYTKVSLDILLRNVLQGKLTHDEEIFFFLWTWVWSLKIQVRVNFHCRVIFMCVRMYILPD